MTTPIQTLLGLSQLSHDLSAALEALLIMLSLACAFAMRRGKRAVTSTTFVLLAGSLVVDVIARLLPNHAVGGKVAVAAYVIFLFGVIRLILEGIDAASRRGRAHFSTIFKDLVMLVLWATVVMTVLYTDFGVQPLSILTTTTVFAAVLGFALQETLGNIFSGLTLQMGRSFEPGDWIKIGNHVGRVRGIGWRATTIVTRANERVDVPNSLMAKDYLYNYATEAVRDEVTVGISYGVPPNHVREVALTLLHDLPQVMREPAPEVLAWEYGESAIVYRVRYWISDYGQEEQIRGRVVSNLWYALRRHAIEIPFPIRTIQMRQPAAVDRADAQLERELMAELRHVDILRGLADDELRVLVPTVGIRQFGAGEMLVRQGEPGASLYIIRSGTVDVLIKTAEGDNRKVRSLDRSDFIGEAALLLGEPRNATCQAATDVEVIEMDREGFSRLFKEHPETVAQISDVIASREAQRREVLAQAGQGDGTHSRRLWLVSKIHEIFDF